MDTVIERLKKEATSLGANAVLLQNTGSEYGGGVSIGTGIFAASDNKTGRGLAIYVPVPAQQ